MRNKKKEKSNEVNHNHLHNLWEAEATSHGYRFEYDQSASASEQQKYGYEPHQQQYPHQYPEQPTWHSQNQYPEQPPGDHEIVMEPQRYDHTPGKSPPGLAWPTPGEQSMNTSDGAFKRESQPQTKSFSDREFNYSGQSYYGSGYNMTIDSPEFQKERPNLMDHFGIFPKIPTLNILKIWAIITLVILVELNIYLNLQWSSFIGMSSESLTLPPILMGIGLIGVFIGIMYRYTQYELGCLKWEKRNYSKADLTIYMKLLFLISIIISLIIWIVFELIFTLDRGILFFIDIFSIMIMAYGTYTIFSGKRHLIIIPLIFIFIIMMLGFNYTLEIPILLLTGVLTIMYIELSDCACKLHEHVLKYHNIISESDYREDTMVHLDAHMEKFTMQFIQNFGVYMVLTVLITIFALALFSIYPYITPAFMNENIELQSIYALLPVIFLLFFVFILIYLFAPKNMSSKEINTNSIE